MRATGIIRRIDDLGRVVIPKEIRRSLRIREGDPLEIYITDDAVTFKRVSLLQEIEFGKITAVIKHILPCGFALVDNIDNVKINKGVDNLKSYYFEDDEGEKYVSHEIMYEGDLILRLVVNVRDANNCSKEISIACAMIRDFLATDN